MKNYRGFVPAIMVVLMFVSWYKLVSDAAEIERKFNTYLSEARRNAEVGITESAIENYEMAINIKNDIDVYVEVAEYLKKQNMKKEYLSWGEQFIEEFPTEAKAYDCILTAYMDELDYVSCYDILAVADKRKVTSDYIEKVKNELKYVYQLDFNSYSDVGIYSNNFSPIKSGDAWGFVDRYGEQRVACIYTKVGAYTQTDFASVVNADGDAFFINKAGSKVMVAKEAYKSFGLLVDNMIAAERPDGKFTYVDSDFNVLFGEYDYASTINNSLGAIKVGDTWQLINNEGKTVTDQKYKDIKLDERQIAYNNDRLFVSTEEGSYILVDGKGEQIGKLSFEDAKVFASDAPAAVKINGKWSFLKNNGELLSDRQYEDARSFANGLAAVCINGKWGFVDEEEQLVIKNDFFGARDFNEKGSCFVNTGDNWQLLKLYRLNREE